MSSFAGAAAEGDAGQRDATEVVVAVATELLDQPSPFALMGVPADATGPQLRRAAERARIAHKVSAPGGGAATGDDAMRQAGQRLADPRARMVHELLWYRPDPDVQGAADPSAPPDQATIERWLATPAADRSPVVVHNLAAQALRHLLYAPSQLAAITEVALLAMNAHLASPATAAYASSRAATLADRRLTPGAAAQLLSALRTAVPLVAIRRVVRLVEQDRRDEARQIMDVLVAQVPGDTLRPLVTKAAEPWRRTLTAAAGRAATGARAELDTTLTLVETFLDQSTRDRAVLDVLLAHDPPQRTEVYDEVVSNCLDVLVRWCNVLADANAVPSGELGRKIEPALALTRRLAPFPCSSLVGGRVSENITTLNDTVEICRQAAVTEVCWFCKAPADGRSINVHLHRDAVREYGRVRFRTLKLPVPRCKGCTERMDPQFPIPLIQRVTRTQILGIAVVSVAIVGAWMAAMLFSVLLAAFGDHADTTYLGMGANPGGVVPGILIWAAIVGGAFAWKRARFPSPPKPPRPVYPSMHDYPPLVAARKDGWMLGAKPLGTR